MNKRRGTGQKVLRNGVEGKIIGSHVGDPNIETSREIGGTKIKVCLSRGRSKTGTLGKEVNCCGGHEEYSIGHRSVNFTLLSHFLLGFQGLPSCSILVTVTLRL